MPSITVRAPATSANLGPGYDVFGLALETPFDVVTISTVPQGITLEVTGISSGTAPAYWKKILLALLQKR